MLSGRFRTHLAIICAVGCLMQLLREHDRPAQGRCRAARALDAQQPQRRLRRADGGHETRGRGLERRPCRSHDKDRPPTPQQRASSSAGYTVSSLGPGRCSQAAGAGLPVSTRPAYDPRCHPHGIFRKPAGRGWQQLTIVPKQIVPESCLVHSRQASASSICCATEEQSSTKCKFCEPKKSSM